MGPGQVSVVLVDHKGRIPGGAVHDERVQNGAQPLRVLVRLRP